MKKNSRIKSTVKYKMLDGKKVPLCDYKGKCRNKAYAEVYPFLLKRKTKNDGWSYLCKKHFMQEQKRFKNKMPYCKA